LFEREQKLCHKCGARGDLKTFTFGLAKMSDVPVEKKDTVGPVVGFLSALLPFFVSLGLIAIRATSKVDTEPEEVLPLRLRVCRNCGPTFWRAIPYEAHPLWDEAQRSGFTEFLTATEVSYYLSQPNAVGRVHPVHHTP
jgi:ribosomal protein L40E